MINAKKYLTLDITHVTNNGEVDLINCLNESEVQKEIQRHISGLQDDAWEIEQIINIETLKDNDNDMFVRMHLLMKQGVSNKVKDKDLV